MAARSSSRRSRAPKDAISAHAEQLDLEDQRRARGDRAREAAVGVGELGRDRELAQAADLHAGDTLVPALDDLPGAELELEALTAVARAVELLTVGERADVVHGHRLSGARLGAGSEREIV